MRSRDLGIRGVATMAVVGALCMGALAGCGGKDSAASADSNAAAQQQTAEDGAADATDTTQTDAQEPTVDAQADGAIDAGSFTYRLPAAWAGRVETGLATGDDGTATAIVTLPGNSEATLATLIFYTDGSEPQAAGDIGSHLAGNVPGDDCRVEVWTINWAWLVANNAIPSGVSEDDLRQLVELSTGGTLSYDDAVAAGADGIGTPDVDFATAELVPTVLIK